MDFSFNRIQSGKPLKAKVGNFCILNLEYAQIPRLYLSMNFRPCDFKNFGAVNNAY